jgi:hypothetical protein
LTNFAGRYSRRLHVAARAAIMYVPRL